MDNINSKDNKTPSTERKIGSPKNAAHDFIDIMLSSAKPKQESNPAKKVESKTKHKPKSKSKYGVEGLTLEAFIRGVEDTPDDPTIQMNRQERKKLAQEIWEYIRGKKYLTAKKEHIDKYIKDKLEKGKSLLPTQEKFEANHKIALLRKFEESQQKK